MNTTRRVKKGGKTCSSSPPRQKKEMTLTPVALMETGKQENFLPAVCERKRIKRRDTEKKAPLA